MGAESKTKSPNFSNGRNYLSLTSKTVSVARTDSSKHGASSDGVKGGAACAKMKASLQRTLLDKGVRPLLYRFGFFSALCSSKLLSTHTTTDFSKNQLRSTVAARTSRVPEYVE